MSGQPTGDARRAIVTVLEYTYGPILVVLGFCLFFAFSDPAQEVILGFLTDVQKAQRSGLFDPESWSLRSLQRVSRNILSITLLIALPVTAYSAAAKTLKTYNITTPFAGPVLLLIPVCALLGYGLGFTRAYFSSEAADIPPQVIAAMLLAILSLLIQFFYVLLNHALLRDTWLGRRLQKIPGANSEIGQIIGQTLSKGPLAYLMWFFLAGVAFVGLIRPAAGDWIGPIGVTAGFAITLTLILSGLTNTSRHMPGNTPLILVGFALSLALNSGAVAVAVVLVAALTLFFHRSLGRAQKVITFCIGALAASYGGANLYQGDCATLSGCNIIHGVPPATARLFSLRQTFVDWPGKDQKVIRLVAAQGGGLYAAYHTAYYLAARADEDPDFAHSIFAISSVSGGSVGAGVFWAIRKSGQCQKPTAGSNCHVNAVNHILKRDFLTPALAGLFFRDNLDNFLPVSALFSTPIDRGSVLERKLSSIVNSWQTNHGSAAGDLLQLPLSASWDTERAAPLLFLNGTRVDDGRKYVLSPVKTLRDQAPAHLELWGQQDLSVINAMLVSARFPVVTPPARVRVRKAGAPEQFETLQLADGGYFDNSGIETAMDILHDIQTTGYDGRIEVIVFSADSELPPPSMRGTLGAPLSAFTSAWRARRDLTSLRLRQFFAREQTSDHQAAFPTHLRKTATRGATVICAARTVPHEVNFTLSWYLAEKTFLAIAKQVDTGVHADQTAMKRLSFGTILRRVSQQKDCSTRTGIPPETGLNDLR